MIGSFQQLKRALTKGWWTETKCDTAKDWADRQGNSGDYDFR